MPGIIALWKFVLSTTLLFYALEERAYIKSFQRHIQRQFDKML